MNLRTALIIVAFAGFLTGCADNAGPELGSTPERFQRGLTGQGNLYQPAADESDPFIRN